MKNTAIIIVLGMAAYLGGFLLAYAAEEDVPAFERNCKLRSEVTR